MLSNGNKTKLQKSGEKLSSEEKKQKRICQLDETAEIKSNLSEDLGLLDKSKELKWDKLMRKIDDIMKQTDILAFKEKKQ